MGRLLREYACSSRRPGLARLRPRFKCRPRAPTCSRAFSPFTVDPAAPVLSLAATADGPNREVPRGVRRRRVRRRSLLSADSSSLPVTLALCTFTYPHASAASGPSRGGSFRMLSQVLRQNLVQSAGASCSQMFYSAGPRDLCSCFRVSSSPHVFVLTAVEDPDGRMWNISKYQCLVMSDWGGREDAGVGRHAPSSRPPLLERRHSNSHRFADAVFPRNGNSPSPAHPRGISQGINIVVVVVTVC